MGWLRKKFKKVGKKIKKFFKSDVGKALGTIALAVAGWYVFGPAAAAGGAGAAGAGGAAAGGAAAGGTAATTTAAAAVPVATSTLTGGIEAGAAGGTVAGTSTITGTTVTPVSNAEVIASNVVDTANAQIASGGTPIVTPELSDAVVQTIENTQTITPTDTKALENLRKTQRLQEEFIKRDLPNLSESIQPRLDQAQLDINPDVFKPESLLDKPIDPKDVQSFDLLNETNLINDKSFTTPKYNPDAFRPEFSVKGEGGWYLGKKLPEGTGEFAAQVGVGTTTSLLTGALMGRDEPEGGGGQLIPYDKSEGPAGNYIADVSNNYQRYGGTPLTFNMYTQQTMPMYGPASPRVIQNNPYIVGA